MLEIHNLSFKTSEKFLIQNISAEFFPGSIYGIIGPNGSGKTSLLKVLTGIWKPTSGTVSWQGQNLLTLDRQTISQTVSLVPQNAHVHFDFTVAEVVEMGTYPCLNLRKAEKKKLVQWALELVDAWQLRNQHAIHISHGERQRMYIARSLVTQSPVLILDEPTSNLDIRHQLETWELLQRLKSQNKIIIITNHDLSSVDRYCDSIIVLNQGLCVAKGPMTLITPTLLKEVFGITHMPKSSIV